MGLRDEKKAGQRRAILEVATALFRERGYDQTRVQDIIERSRISEATFFNYFPKKDALLFELAIDQIDGSIAKVEEQLGKQDRTVPDRLRHLVRSWADDWESDREFNALVAMRSGMLTSASGTLRDKGLELYAAYERLLKEGQRRGEIRADTPPLYLAEMLEGLLVIVGGNWLVGWWKDRREPLHARMMRALEFFLRGCAAADEKTAVAGRKPRTPRRVSKAK